MAEKAENKPQEPGLQPGAAPEASFTSATFQAPPNGSPAVGKSEDVQGVQLTKDVPMTDATGANLPPTQTAPISAPSPSQLASAAASATPSQPPPPQPSASPLPARTGTPTMREAPAGAAPGASRAASALPADQAPDMPTEAEAHGAAVRQYINGKITTVLLEGMKVVAKEQPKDPLRVLGEFLIQRSKEIEGKP